MNRTSFSCDAMQTYIVYSTVSLLFSLSTVIINVTVIYCIWTTRNKEKPNRIMMLFIILSANDVVVGAVFFPHAAYQAIVSCSISNTNMRSILFIRFSMCMTILISICRYLCIVHNRFYEKHVNNNAVYFVALFAFIFNVILNLIHRDFELSSHFQSIVFFTTSCLWIFFTLLLLVLNVVLMRHVRKHAATSQAINQNARRRYEADLTKTIILINTMLILICAVPMVIPLYIGLAQLSIIDANYEDLTTTADCLFILLASSSLWNAVIQILRCTKLKRFFKTAFKKYCIKISNKHGKCHIHQDVAVISRGQNARFKRGADLLRLKTI